MSAGTRGWKTAAGCRPSRTRATCSPRASSTTGPGRTPRPRCRRSSTACCRWSRPDRPRSCATIIAIGDHVRILPTPGHTPGHVAFTFGRGKDDAVFCRRPDAFAAADALSGIVGEIRRRSGAGGDDAARFLERYCDTERCAAPRISPRRPPAGSAAGATDLPARRMSATRRIRNAFAGSGRRARHDRSAEPAGRFQRAQHPDGHATRALFRGRRPRSEEPALHRTDRIGRQGLLRRRRSQGTPRHD